MSRDASLNPPTYGRTSYDGVRSLPPRAAAPRIAEPDVRLKVGENPRPAGNGWLLVDYGWNEKTGLGRLVFKRKWNPKERVLVEIEQPAGPYHAAWFRKPEIDREALLARYFEALQVTNAMTEAGAYGR